MKVKILNDNEFVNEKNIEFYCRTCKKFTDNVHVSSLGFILCVNCKTVVARTSE